MQAEALDEVRRNSGWLVALGILMILLGIAAIAEPFLATLIATRALSWTFLFAGIVRLVQAIQSRKQRGFWLKLLIGILYVVMGFALLGNIFGAALTLTLAFGIVILAQGILEVITAFQVRPDSYWGLVLLSGIVSIILGILILNRWPSNAIWLLGLFMGVSFLFTGLWMISLPSTARRYPSEV
jgi:uncharacterized membrane protein HdeD (DUF308 family)